MEVKEAVEFLNIFRGQEGKRTEQILPCDEWNFKLDSIISLLQQGEKYRQMWEELIKGIEKREKRCEIACDIVYVSTLRDIKQKYFLKEASQDYPEGEE